MHMWWPHSVDAQISMMLVQMQQDMVAWELCSADAGGQAARQGGKSPPSLFGTSSGVQHTSSAGSLYFSSSTRSSGQKLRRWMWRSLHGKEEEEALRNRRGRREGGHECSSKAGVASGAQLGASRTAGQQRSWYAAHVSWHPWLACTAGRREDP